MNDSTPSVIFSLYKDQPIYRDLLQDFVDCLEDRVTQGLASFQTQSWHELSRAMHQLRGAAATYGFPSLAEIAGGLEVATAPHEAEIDAAAVASSLSTLRETCRSIEAGMAILQNES